MMLGAAFCVVFGGAVFFALFLVLEPGVYTLRFCKEWGRGFLRRWLIAGRRASVDVADAAWASLLHIRRN